MDSLIWERQGRSKNNKRVSLIKKMVPYILYDEIWPSLCPVKGSEGRDPSSYHGRRISELGERSD